MARASGRPPRSGFARASPFAMVKSQLPLVDLVLEVCDARVPVSSRHPQTGRIFGGKPRVIVLAKADLAEPDKVRLFAEKLTAFPGQAALPVDLKLGRNKARLISLALHLTAARRASLERKGLKPRPMRACVVGMPNVGKSSLINWLIGRRKTLVADRPGITKGPQWVRVSPQLELLDTPGILPPVQLPEDAELKLAIFNLLPEKSYDPEEVADAALHLVTSERPEALAKYQVESPTGLPTLEELARAMHCLKAGGRPDTRRASQLFLRDLRAGALGRLTLDHLERSHASR